MLSAGKAKCNTQITNEVCITVLIQQCITAVWAGRCILVSMAGTNQAQALIECLVVLKQTLRRHIKLYLKQQYHGSICRHCRPEPSVLTVSPQRHCQHTIFCALMPGLGFCMQHHHTMYMYTACAALTIKPPLCASCAVRCIAAVIKTFDMTGTW